MGEARSKRENRDFTQSQEERSSSPWGREDLSDLPVIGRGLIYSEQRNRGQSTQMESKGPETRNHLLSIPALILHPVAESWPNVSPSLALVFYL